ncbi:MAG: hypothetical protein ACTSYR_00725 [Candidatus Odinarchaeia archaeon]
MGLKRAIFYSIITIVSTLSPSIGDRIAPSFGVEFNSFFLYENIIITVAVVMTALCFIENYFLETKTAVSGIAGLLKHVTYILWTFFTFEALQSFTYFSAYGPILLDITYLLVRDLILIGLGLKLIIYMLQIVFHKDIQTVKETEVQELRGKV